ncbi:MAG: mechanosensitive ion channel family protein [Bacillota bacterium]
MPKIYGIWLSFTWDCSITSQELIWKLMLSGMIIIAAVLIILFARHIIDRLFASSTDTKPLVNPGLFLITAATLKAVALYGGIFLTILLILEVFNVTVFKIDDLKDFGFKILKVIAIVVGAKLLIKFLRTLVSHFVSPSGQEGEAQVLSPRAKTLVGLLNSIVTYGIFFIAGLMILEAFRINTTAILASVGILGLAVGFGAQNLVRDVISGFFIIFDDQFRVGEFVEAGGATGVVEEIGLRTTKIKRWTGHLEIIPNGEISKVVNYSRANMLAVVVVGVAYEEDIDKAQEVLRKICETAYQEIKTIVEVPVVQGVVALADSSVDIRVIARTLPGEQWAVERELLGRFKKGLDEAGIEIPYPRRVIYQR